MSRTRIIGGSYTKITRGDYSLYSDNNIITTAGKAINETGVENGIVYGEPEAPPPSTPVQKIAYAIVYFRPDSGYNGEYGFDWLREDDNGLGTEPAYKGIIESGYTATLKDVKGNRRDLTKSEAFHKLEGEYNKIAITRKPALNGATQSQLPVEYFVPYLTLFSKDFVTNHSFATGVTKPKYEATLKVLVDIEEDLDKLEFEYDNTLFSLDKTILSDKNKTAGIITSADKTITITCLKDLKNNKEIKIYAYPQGIMAKTKAEQMAARKLAGKIKILKNDEGARHKLNFVLVPVLTDTSKSGNIVKGRFTDVDKRNFYNSCYQALIVPFLEDSQNALDLSTNHDFQVFNLAGSDKYGKFIYNTNAPGADQSRNDKTIWEDAPGFFSAIQHLFLNEKDSAGKPKNSKYLKGYFTAFAMEVQTYDDTPGQIQGVNIKNLILFNSNRYATTMAHESLHGLGLYHTHRDGGSLIKEPNRKYVYQYKTTDNIMSYNTPVRKTTWHWQWKIINSKVL